MWREGRPENRGFWLGKPFWGKGYMTEAVAPVMDYAFNNFGFEKLVFANAVGNLKSRRVKEKTGAKLIDVKPAKFVNPEYTEHEIWELKREVHYIKDYVFNYYEQGVPEPFGITLKDEPSKLIGTVGCFWVSKKAKCMEIAYAISEDYWGKGLVAEASSAVIDYCFNEFKLKRIQARCKSVNKPSARVMEKIGMTYEGTLKSAVFHREKYWDMHYYGKIMP